MDYVGAKRTSNEEFRLALGLHAMSPSGRPTHILLCRLLYRKGHSETLATGRGADVNQATFYVYVDTQCPNEETAFSTQRTISSIN
jgi:hypothetical protein